MDSDYPFGIFKLFFKLSIFSNSFHFGWSLGLSDKIWRERIPKTDLRNFWLNLSHRFQRRILQYEKQSSWWAPVLQSKRPVNKNLKRYIKIWFGPVISNFHFEDWKSNNDILKTGCCMMLKSHMLYGEVS
jgi:hypothetical protein